uniref:NADH:ubiquinone reductase (H(+)-translocating) n=1 Tax=Colposcenia aliena TaxID=3101724 RepID=A0AAU8G8B1_9HEMI
MKFMNKFYLASFTFILVSLIFISLFCLFSVNEIILLMEINMMNLNSIEFKFIMLVDWMSLIFSGVVFLISGLVLIYSKDYLGEDCLRFLWLTIFFVLFMLMMIMSPSILGVILGWDGLGLISYCLVIYYQSKTSFNSGFITAASNRLGDSLLILSIVFCSFFGNFLFWEINLWSIPMFLTACLTKSAQFPFSAWLPLAMAAPTPISSLVHSSTLVTAGVYMCIRFNSSLHMLNINLILFLISGFTIILASLSSFLEYDLKRIIAFSTLSQLGFMMMILSLGFSFISFFHLLIHALFKALLFLCAGCFIHSGGSIQDLRKMGSMNMNLFMKFSMIISSFSLMGVPFSSGFYSKDLMLEFIFMSWGGVGIGMFMLLCALLTISYSVRIFKLMNMNNIWVLWLEPSMMLLFSVILLSLMNIILGCSLSWIMINVQFVCVSLEFKFYILIMLVISLIWQGELNFNMNYFFIYSMFYLMSISKNMSKVISLIYLLFKHMDQGWMEYILNYMKMYTIQLSFWWLNILFNYYMYMYSIWFLIIMFIMF